MNGAVTSLAFVPFNLLSTCERVEWADAMTSVLATLSSVGMAVGCVGDSRCTTGGLTEDQTTAGLRGSGRST